MRMKIKLQPCNYEQPTLPPWEGASKPGTAAVGDFCAAALHCSARGRRLSQSSLHRMAGQNRAAGTPVAERTRDAARKVSIAKRTFCGVVLYGCGLGGGRQKVSSSEESSSQALSSRGLTMRLFSALQIHQPTLLCSHAGWHTASGEKTQHTASDNSVSRALQGFLFKHTSRLTKMLA